MYYYNISIDNVEFFLHIIIYIMIYFDVFIVIKVGCYKFIYTIFFIEIIASKIALDELARKISSKKINGRIKI